MSDFFRWLAAKSLAALAAIWAGLRRVWLYIRGLLSEISGGVWRAISLAAPALYALYIVVGMALENRIDDTLDLVAQPPPGGVQSVAVMTALLKRETTDHNWTPNDPFFMPGWWIDNTPNFQKGMIGALSRFSFELRDQLGRTRGSSAVEPELETAAGNLSREPERWVLDFSNSLLPTTPADSYYRQARRGLERYNARLAAGTASFERRADNLRATLDRIALDLGASSAALDAYIAEKSGGWFLDFGSDDLFYQVKGQVYAYTLLLTGLEQDFEAVLQQRELAALFRELLLSMRRAAALSPLVVSNGAVDGITANHLALQGFYLLRARTQLREVTQILLN